MGAKWELSADDKAVMVDRHLDTSLIKLIVRIKGINN